MSPLRTVLTDDSPLTHLVALSPALIGSRPDQLPERALCGRSTYGWGHEAPADVQCPRCLSRAPRYMHLPAFEDLR